MEIVVIGKGAFGQALGSVLEKSNHSVKFVQRDSVWPTSKAVAQLVFLCVPTQKIPQVVKERHQELHSSFGIVSTSKGLLQNTLLTPLQYIQRESPQWPPLFCLSGPSFASDVLQNLPTALVLASQHKKLNNDLIHSLNSSNLRLYSNPDPFGVELCGALKNVYALMTGICDGLKLGDSARAALTTRALAEMTRIVTSLGGDARTVGGLAGVGDLFLTCTSSKSRNYSFGLKWSLEQDFQACLDEFGTVEGYWTSSAAADLCKKNGISAPLIEAVQSLLSGKASPIQTLSELMSRSPKSEYE